MIFQKKNRSETLQVYQSKWFRNGTVLKRERGDEVYGLLGSNCPWFSLRMDIRMDILMDIITSTFMDIHMYIRMDIHMDISGYQHGYQH